MQNLSTLIFSRDDTTKTIKLIDHVLEFSDQIVVMDSSSSVNFSRLNRAMRKFPKGKVVLYPVLAFGYPDPLREYGLHKCKYDWILYIDTDERINVALKRSIKKIINDPKCDAFAIKRYEHAHLDGRKGDFFTWQIRLYNKKKIRYRGLLHEQPIVKGNLKKLGDEYCMLHVEELKTKGTKRRDLEYSLIKKYYDRLSYLMLNERMKEYLDKLVLPEDRKIEQTLIGKVVLGWMKFYQTVTFRNMDSEISTFDYFMFFSMIEGAYALKMKDMRYLFDEAIPTIRRDTRSASQFKKEKEGKKIFDISKEVNRNGMIKYLKLDDDRVVDKLYEKHKNSKQGIALLMKLLEQRHDGNYP